MKHDYAAFLNQFLLYDVQFTQQQMQAFLSLEYDRVDMQQVLERLFEWELATGYITKEKLYDNPHYEYPDPDTGIIYTTQVNIARSKYSPKPIVGQDIPTLHCPICYENIGIPGKEALRAFVFELTPGRDFFIQLTPFPLFPYHGVVIDRRIRPMIMETQSVIDMLSFVKMAPQYVMLSNSDVVGAGASIISHHHYQTAKNLRLPIMQAPAFADCERTVSSDGGRAIVTLLDFPIACARVDSDDEAALVKVSGAIIERWKECDPGKNTCNLVLMQQLTGYSCYILFRNPAFLTPDDLLRIKTEYIGIVEVCGEGIYPVPEGDDADKLWQEIESGGLAIIKGIIDGNNPIKPDHYKLHFKRLMSWL